MDGRRRRPLLASAAVAAALIAVGQARPARAAVVPTGPGLGSYRGTVTSATGATVATPSDTRTNITVTAANAVIDWTPNNIGVAGPTIEFQPAGTTAVFTSGGQDYTVLNRINTGLDGRAVSFNGVTTSYIGAESPGRQGGQIWFYSPGGILVGATGRFDVGSLVLTANRIQTIETGYGVTLRDASGNIVFDNADILNSDGSIKDRFNPNATVTLTAPSSTVAGPTITATRQNSYVALVAPRIVQGGSIDVNGSAALVAAEAATVRITPNNLFDITVTSGASAPADGSAVLQHTGTTTGDAGTQGNPHAIYMVAVPKNDAITMLVQGSVGYRGAALDAAVENGTVVLSAGSNIVSRAETGYGFTRARVTFSTPTPAATPGGGSITISNANFTSGVFGSAVTDTTALAAGGTPVTFRGNATFTSGRQTAFSASGAATLPATLGALGNLSLTGATGASVAATQGSVTVARALTLVSDNAAGNGGTVSIAAVAGGTVSVGNGTTLSATGAGATTAAVRGGTAMVSATQGTVTLSGGLTIDVSGTALANGPVTGGTARLTSDSGQISIGNTSIAANAFSDYGGATGGAITLETLAGRTTPTGVTPRLALGSLNLAARGEATSENFNTTDVATGTDTGGTVTISAAKGAIGTGAQSATIDVSGIGGRGADSATAPGAGGTGVGGTVSITTAGDAVTFGDALVRADGLGGDAGALSSTNTTAPFTAGAAGGAARGGSVTLLAGEGAFSAGYAVLTAEAVGGTGGYSNQGPAGTGGSGTGGTISVSATRANPTGTIGSISTPSGLGLKVQAQGGAGGTLASESPTIAPGGIGGGGTGGTATITVDSGATLSAGGTYLIANGAGATGGQSATGYGAAGMGFGGIARITGGTGTLTLGTTELVANGGNFNGAIGPTHGGTASFTTAGTALSTSSIAMTAAGGVQFDPFDDPLPFGPYLPFGPRAFGGAGAPAAGASAQGGTVSASFSGGTFADYGTISLAADATGYGLPTQGGLASLSFDNVTLATSAGISVTAGGSQGSFFAGTTAGGAALLTLGTGSSVTTGGDVLVDASGNASNSNVLLAAGAGAAGAGGAATLAITGGTLNSGGAVTVSAQGLGADTPTGVIAGPGSGGDATVSILGGGRLSGTSLDVNAYAFGGSSGGNESVDYASVTPTSGGAATGGNAIVTIGTATLDIQGGIALDASASGGGSNSGGSSGNATAGTARFESGYGGGVSAVSLGDLQIYAVGRGGTGAEDGYGNGGAGGDGAGGTASAIISGTTLSLSGVRIDARGLGGDGDVANTAGLVTAGGAGGNGAGGTASLTVAADLTAASVQVLGSGTGGNGGDSNASVGGNGGTGTGRAATLALRGVNVSTDTLTVDAAGLGGSAGLALASGTTGVSRGGAAQGGAASLSVGSGRLDATTLTVTGAGVGGAVRDDTATTPVPSLVSGPSGGFTGYGVVTGGGATAGSATLTGTGTTITSETLTVDASATGGTAQGSGYGGSGTGGAAFLGLTDGGLDVTAALTISGAGAGGDSILLAGSGTGGSARFTAGTQLASAGGSLPAQLAGDPANGPTVTLDTDLTIDASGRGGITGGAGTGGSARFDVGAGTTDITGFLKLDAAGVGTASTTAAGGAGTGGAAAVNATGGGALTIGSTLTVDASGAGAEGIGGGRGTGGAASAGANEGSIAATGRLTLVATGTGGIGRSGGNGGAGTGGSGSIALTGTAAGAAALRAPGITFDVSGAGGDARQATSGLGGLNGGAGTGGTASLTVVDASFTQTALDIVATGRGGNGYAIAAAGGGGSATGGTVTVSSTSDGSTDATSLDFDALTIDVRAFGGSGTGYGVTFGANGGSAFSGAATLDIGAGALTASTVTILGEATGAAGRNSDAAPALAGGNGGAARGAAITIGTSGGTLAVDTFTTSASAVGGSGGAGGSGGNGGNATAGSLTLLASGGATADFGNVGYALDATGGTGGIARRAGGAGGSGGDATGGTLAVTATGTGSRITLAAPTITITATGGAGQDGLDGTTGGRGGNGGDATGGTVSVGAVDGGAVVLANVDGTGPTIRLDATAGFGGDGGDGSGYGNTGGIGGDGGVGTGGTAQFTATGGTITLGNLAVTATGYGAEGGFGGTGATFAGIPAVPPSPGNPNATPPVPPSPGSPAVPAIPGVRAASGAASQGKGGILRLTANDASTDVAPEDRVAARITGGAVNAALSGFDSDLNGTVVSTIADGAGLLTVTNLSASDGRIDLGDVTLDNQGGYSAYVDDDGYSSSFHVRSDQGLVHFANGAINAGGGAAIITAGDGRFEIDGDLTVNSANAFVRHDGTVADHDTVHAGGSLNFGTIYGFTAGDGAQLRGDDSISVRNSFYDPFDRFGIMTSGSTLIASQSVTLSSAGVVEVGNVRATASVNEDGDDLFGGTVDIRSGDDEIYNSASLTVNGTVSSALATRLIAGASVLVNDGGAVESGNLVDVHAGNDIIVSSGGAVRGALDPARDEAGSFEDSVGSAGVILRAGALEGQNYSINDNVNAIIVNGTVSGGDRAVSLRAGGTLDLSTGEDFQPGAIDTRGGTIVARSLIAGIDDAPAPGDTRSDFGQLTAPCLAGAICLGPVTTSRTLLVGGMSGTELLPTNVSIQGSTANDQTIIRSRAAITLGAPNAEVPSVTITGRDLLLVQSTEDAVNLTPGTALVGGITNGDFGGSVNVAGETGIAGGGATITAQSGSVGLYTGSGSLTLGGLTTSRLQTLNADLSVANDGALRVAGDVDIGVLTVSDANADITADGGINVGSVTTPQSVNFTALGGTVALGSTTSSVGSITLFGNDVSFGNIAADGNISASAGYGAISGGTANAGGDIAFDAPGDIIFDSADAGGRFIASTQGAFSANSVNARGGDLDVTAAGDILAGDLYAHGDVNLLSQANVTVDEAETGALDTGTDGGNINVTADGNVTMETADADMNVTVDAGGDVDIGVGNAGRAITVRADGSIALDDGRARDAITLTAGGAIRSATALVTEGSGYGGTGNIALSAVGGIALGGVDAAGDLSATSTGGGVTATGPLRAARSVTVTGQGGDVALADVTAGMTLALTAGSDATVANLRAGQLTAGGAATLRSTGTLAATGLVATNADVLARGGVTLGVVRTGPLSVVSDTDAISIADVETSGDLRVTAPTSLTIGRGRSTTGAIDLAAGGALAANTLIAATSISGTGATISGGDETAATSIALTATGALTAGQLTTTGGTGETGVALGAIDLTGGSVAIGGASAATTLALTATGGDIAVTNALTSRATIDARAAAGGIRIGSTNAGSVLTLAARDTIRVGALASSAGSTATAGGALAIDSANVGGNLVGTAGTDVSVGSATAANRLALMAGGALTATGTLSAGGDLILGAARDVAVNTLSANGMVVAQASGGALTAGNVTAGGTAMLGASGALRVGDATSSGGALMLAGGGLTGGNLRARNSISARSTAGVTLAAVESVGGSVGVVAARDIATGNVRAAGSIAFTGGGAITAGDLTAGTGPLLDTSGGTTSVPGGVDPTTSGIGAGFDQNVLPANDDDSTESPVALGFMLNYFGNSYANTFVSNNGYVTFNAGSGDYTPTGLGPDYSGQPIIAAFFADVDTRGDGSREVTYGTGTYAGRQAFGANFVDVGYFDTNADKTNSFQIVLTNRSDTGAGNFDIYYNYARIRWETGDVDGGVNGFGGVSAAVGYNAGTGNQAGTFYELPGSRVAGSFLDGGPLALVTGTNDGVPGQLFFAVRNGQVVTPTRIEAPTIQVTNVAAGNTAAITLGNLTAEGVQVHGAGQVTTGDVAVRDLGSGVAVAGNALSTAIEATTALRTGNVAGAGLVVLGADAGDIATGAITSGNSVVLLASGSVLPAGRVTTGTGATDSLFISNPSVTSSAAFAGFSFDTLLTSNAFAPARLASATPTRIGGSIGFAAPIATGNLLAAATGPITLSTVDATGLSYLDSAGAIAVNRITAGGTITFAAASALTAPQLVAGTDIVARNIGTASLGTLTAARDLQLGATGTVTATGALTAGRDLTVRGGPVTLADATAGDDLTLGATGALAAQSLTSRAAANTDAEGDGSRIAVTATGAATIDRVAGAGAVTLAAGGPLQVTTDLVAAGPVTATGSAVALNARSPLTLASVTGTTGGVNVDSVGDLTVTTARAAGSIVLASSQGAVTLGAASTQLAQTQQAADAGRAPAAVISTSGASGRGDITVRAATTAALTGTVDARDDVSVTSGGLTRIGGSTLGTNVALTSADVAVGTTARIGRGAGTTSVTFTNGSTSNPTYLGTNTGGTGGYALDTAELGTVAAQTVRVLAPNALSGTTPEITVGDLAIGGSAGTQVARLYGGAAGLSIETPGRIRVTGNVAMGSSAASDTLTLSAGRTLDVVTPGASVTLTGTGTTPAGRLILAANQITVGSAQAATDIAGLTSTDARDARLGRVDGTAKPEGYLAANAIEFRIASALYVQNSGISGDLGSTGRGGFTAGTGGVTIVSSAPTTSPATVVINGRIANGDGTFATGAAIIPKLVIRGNTTQTTASLDARSTANGCLIVGLSCRFDIPTTPTTPTVIDLFPIQDTIQEGLDPDRDVNDRINGDPTEGIIRREVPLIEEPDFAAYVVAPAIDEPVTGAGNDDLWAQPDCLDPNDTTCSSEGTPSPNPAPAPTTPAAAMGTN